MSNTPIVASREMLPRELAPKPRSAGKKVSG